MSTTPARVSAARHLAGLLNQAADPIFALDARGRLIFANRAWELLTGRKASDVLGRVCTPPGPTPPEDLDALAASLAPPPEALAGRDSGGPVAIPGADGHTHARRIEFVPLLDPRGEPVGFLGHIRPRDAEPGTPDSRAQAIRAELDEIRARLRRRHGFDALIGRGPAHRRLLDQLAAAAAARVPVLVLGEPGTGRRLVARIIHQQAGPDPGPLRYLDCAALPPEVVGRELDQLRARPPSPESAPPAAGPTLLLADVPGLARDVQARLAGLIEDSGVRLIATTSAEPEAARRQERLIPEIYFALTTLVVRLAPLRDRLDELPLLAQHFLDRANQQGEKRVAGFEPEALEALAEYDWPGNLRELARVVEAAHQRAGGPVLRAADLPAAIRGDLGAAYLPPPILPPVKPLDEALTQVERRLIEQALQRARQNKSRAAELLDISRPRLYRRIKELNIPDVPEADGEPRGLPAEETIAGDPTPAG